MLRHEDHRASVPVSVVSVHLIYCHFCQAWSTVGSSITQFDAEAMEVRQNHSTEFGPFDDETDVLAQSTRQLTEMLTDSAAPWVARLPRG